MTELTEFTCREMTAGSRAETCTPTKLQMCPYWAARTVGIQLPRKVSET